jgi:hypothetical protein
VLVPAVIRGGPECPNGSAVSRPSRERGIARLAVTADRIIFWIYAYSINEYMLSLMNGEMGWRGCAHSGQEG